MAVAFCPFIPGNILRTVRNRGHTPHNLEDPEEATGAAAMDCLKDETLFPCGAQE
jgi:hypothetical protein